MRSWHDDAPTVMYSDAYSDPVITVRVLRLFHNNESGYSLYAFIAETMHNLLNTKLLILVVRVCSN